MKVRLMLAASIALFLASIVFAFFPKQPPAPERIGPLYCGFRDFVAADLQGNRASTAALRKGKALLLAFTDTSCPWAKEEMQIVEQLSATLKDRDLQVVAVFVKDKPEAVKPLAEGKAYTALLDGGGLLAKQYSVVTVPTVMLIDYQGQLVYRNTGLVPAEDLTKELDKTLNSARDG
jgi:peroxiredoxin